MDAEPIDKSHEEDLTPSIQAAVASTTAPVWNEDPTERLFGDSTHWRLY